MSFHLEQQKQKSQKALKRTNYWIRRRRRSLGLQNGSSRSLWRQHARSGGIGEIPLQLLLVGVILLHGQWLGVAAIAKQA